jgi:hypothetical protein
VHAFDGYFYFACKGCGITGINHVLITELSVISWYISKFIISPEVLVPDAFDWGADINLERLRYREIYGICYPPLFGRYSYMRTSNDVQDFCGREDAKISLFFLLI